MKTFDICNAVFTPIAYLLGIAISIVAILAINGTIINPIIDYSAN